MHISVIASRQETNQGPHAPQAAALEVIESVASEAGFLMDATKILQILNPYISGNSSKICNAEC